MKNLLLSLLIGLTSVSSIGCASLFSQKDDGSQYLDLYKVQEHVQAQELVFRNLAVTLQVTDPEVAEKLAAIGQSFVALDAAIQASIDVGGPEASLDKSFEYTVAVLQSLIDSQVIAPEDVDSKEVRLVLIGIQFAIAEAKLLSGA